MQFASFAIKIQIEEVLFLVNRNGVHGVYYITYSLTTSYHMPESGFRIKEPPSFAEGSQYERLHN
jgi:hypothetical protein